MNGQSEEVLLRLTIPGNPIPKKNNMRILHTPQGRAFIAPSKRFDDFQKQCAQHIPDSARVGISQACNIECRYFRADHRRVDLTNLLQSTDDILVHYGVLADDNSKIVAGHDGNRVFYDKENPRTELIIIPLDSPQENS